MTGARLEELRAEWVRLLAVEGEQSTVLGATQRLRRKAEMDLVRAARLFVTGPGRDHGDNVSVRAYARGVPGMVGALGWAVAAYRVGCGLAAHRRLVR